MDSGVSSVGTGHNYKSKLLKKAESCGPLGGSKPPAQWHWNLLRNLRYFAFTLVYLRIESNPTS